MTTFFYKTGGKVSRSLLDYEGDYIGQVNTFTLDDWWEEQYQTYGFTDIWKATRRARTRRDPSHQDAAPPELALG